MTDAQRLEHNRLYEEATALSKNELNLHGSRKSPPGWWLRRKLTHAVQLYSRVVALNSENWAAMWLAGKIEERLGNREASLNWLARSYQINPSQPDVAREASMAAMELGRNEDGIAYAHRAVQIDPKDAGLKANLALAYLLAGQTDSAQAFIGEALSANPHDAISKTIAAMIEHFAVTGATPPNTTPALLELWKRRPKR